MKKTHTLLFVIHTLTAILIFLHSSFPVRYTDKNDEIDAIRATVQLYVDGVKYSDTSKLEEAFHEDWRMTGFYQEGNYTRFDSERFIRMIDGSSRSVREEPIFDGGIVDIQHHGRVAIAKIQLENERVVYTDYLSLLKIDGEWTIIHKIWDTVPQNQ